MRGLIEDIITQLKTVPGQKFVLAWNDQIYLDEGRESYSFEMPALFVEFQNPQEIKQLGDGIQLYDPLTVRIHILHWQLDAGSGDMEQNLDAWDFSQEVFKVMDGYEPDGASAFVRGFEERDYQHKGIYHLIQDYKATYLDCTKQRSTDGVTVGGGVISPDITATFDPIKPYLKGL